MAESNERGTRRSVWDFASEDNARMRLVPAITAVHRHTARPAGHPHRLLAVAAAVALVAVATVLLVGFAGI